MRCSAASAAPWRPVLHEIEFTDWHRQRRQALPALLVQHPAVVVRNVPPHPRHQLRLCAMLGPLVGRTRDWSRLSYLPDMRLESDTRINPFNRIWHCDTSWAQTPAQYTALFALEAAPDCATTELADVAAGYAALPQARAREIESWRAFHHVARSRQTRFASIEPAAPALRAPGGRLQAFAARWRLGSTVRAVRLTEATPPGVLHPVVATDVPTGKRHLLLGEHAWRLEHLNEADSACALDALTDACVHSVQEHRWRVGDLLIFNNRIHLHRRGDGAEGRRTLRRVLVLPA